MDYFGRPRRKTEKLSSQRRERIFIRNIVVWTLIFAGISLFLGIFFASLVGAALGATTSIEMMLYVAFNLFFSLPIFAVWAIGIVALTLRYWIYSCVFPKKHRKRGIGGTVV